MNKHDDEENGGAGAASPKTGYKSPPHEHKFKKGKSGNPKGRPKKAVSVGQIWVGLAQDKCEMVIGGKKKKMTRIEAVATTVMAKALKGDLKAAATVIQAYALYGPTADVNANVESAKADKAVLEQFLEKLKKGVEENGE